MAIIGHMVESGARACAVLQRPAPCSVVQHVVRGGQRPSRPAAPRPRRSWRCRSAELEEVDLMTGMVVEGTTMGVQAGRTLQAAGLKWAFRSADVNQAASTPDKLPVLCLHGIGSCSYAYRTTLRLLGEAGHEAFAPDLIGHGGSSKPSSGFDYSAEAYVQALSDFVDAVGIKRPFALVVHGFILGQFSLLYALENAEDVAKLVLIDTPLHLKTKLRPELAAYKAPLAFIRPKADATFDAMNFNAAGSPYAMAYRDAQAYAAPYEEGPAASAAVHKTMEGVDFPALLRRVDEGFKTWRKPSLVVLGTADPFIGLAQTLDWLESKRTCMKMAAGLEAKMGHCPMEDYAEGLHPVILQFLEEGSG